ncbi:hypothetical protein FRAHR75_120011 [Frankia sp. Hr75.2]|nr:hypothetical protein FRAHR75_120011 [Frankia sp. Hr75.2]
MAGPLDGQLRCRPSAISVLMCWTRTGGLELSTPVNRARIVAAATTMLRERGLDVDMRAIAREAGVGVGTLYRHFPTRQHLVKEITNTDLAGLATSSLPPGPSAIDALRAFFTAALTPLVHNRAAVDLLANADPSGAELQRCVAHLTGSRPSDGQSPI